MDFTIVCPCCGDEPVMTVTGGDLAAWRRVAQNGQVTDIACAGCGCQYNPTDQTTSIGQVDVSRPRIDSLTPSSTSVAGGASVAIAGHALDVGTLVLKVDGAAVAASGITDNAAQFVAPAGKPVLKTQGATTGALAPGDVVTGATSGHTATIHSLVPGGVKVSGPSGGFQAGEWIEKDVNNRVQLAAANHYDGAVAVTVENQYGRRAAGATATLTFTV